MNQSTKSSQSTPAPSSQTFYNLDPNWVLQACEQQGYKTTGELTQLNSFENRVYEVRLEDAKMTHLICKIYRPGRWSRSTIEDEHHFLAELAQNELSVAAPLCPLFEFQNLFFGLFPKFRGRLIQEFLPHHLTAIGKLLAQTHNTGAKSLAQNRFKFNHTHPGGEAGLELLHEWIAPEVRQRYSEAAEVIFDFLCYEMNEKNFIRIHGDCHRGNIIETTEGLALVDFDDFGMGPAVQDFWMLLSTDLSQDPDQYHKELDTLIDGYTTFRTFDESELNYIPALRGLRIISYAAWIAKRWQDPTFPKLFPDFKSYNYWAEEVEALERIAHQL